MKPRKFNCNIPYSISSSELSEILGIGKRQIEKLAKAGECVRLAHGEYDLVSSFRNYLRFIRDKANSRGPEDLQADVLRETARKLKLANDLKEGEQLDVVEFENFARIMQATYNNQLDSLAPRMAARVASETEPAIVLDLLMDEIRRIRDATSGELAQRFGLDHENVADE